MSSSISPTFTAGGLISGLDTNSMVDKLTSLESLPITQMKSQQSALNTQISTLGALASSLSALGSVADGLSTGGIVSANAVTTSSDYSATAGAGATDARHSVSVQSLATAAMMRSSAFSSGMSPVTGGSLQLSVGGKSATVTMTDGMQLADVAKAINSTGLRVSASVLSTGTSVYLSVTTLDTGYDPKSTPGSALQIAETSTGTQGTPLGATSITAAANAQFTVDGLAFTRQSNTVADAIDGVTLNLRNSGSPASDLVVSTDPAGSQANLQRFVDAYNSLMSKLNTDIAPAPGDDPNLDLAGDETARSMQSQLQSLTSASVSGNTGAVRSLADLGVKTNYQDGSLSIDAAAFGKAFASDPNGIKSLFTAAKTGLDAQVKALTTQYTDPLNGSIPQRTQGMQQSITDLDKQIAQSQLEVNAYHDSLLSQFASMETILAGLKTDGNYLTQIFTPTTSSK